MLRQEITTWDDGQFVQMIDVLTRHYEHYGEKRNEFPR